MAELKIWVLGRMLGQLDDEGNPTGAYIAEIMAEDWPIRCVDILRHANLPGSPIAITAVGPVTPAQALAIHNLARYVVLAARYTANEDENGANAGLPYPGWGPDDPLTTDRWTEIRTGLIAVGFPATILDTWRTSNPDATPRDFYRALVNFLEGVLVGNNGDQTGGV